MVGIFLVGITFLSTKSPVLLLFLPRALLGNMERFLCCCFLHMTLSTKSRNSLFIMKYIMGSRRELREIKHDEMYKSWSSSLQVPCNKHRQKSTTTGAQHPMKTPTIQTQRNNDCRSFRKSTRLEIFSA